MDQSNDKISIIHITNSLKESSLFQKALECSKFPIRLQLKTLRGYRKLIKYLKSNPLPDAIIVDDHMIDRTVDGLPMVQALKNTYPKIRVIMHSFIEDSDALERGRRLGITEFISKRIENWHHLSQLIYEAISRTLEIYGT